MTSDIEYIRRDNTYCRIGSRSFLLYDEAVRAIAGTDVEPTDKAVTGRELMDAFVTANRTRTVDDCRRYESYRSAYGRSNTL